jgi:hypothetical protein
MNNGLIGVTMGGAAALSREMEGLIWSIPAWTSKATAIAALVFAASMPSARATTYYVSSTLGNDSNDGTTVSAPWKSPRKLYIAGISSQFNPGDSVLFKAGDSFDGPIQTSGNASGGDL